MLSLNLVVSAGIVFILILLAILFLIPAEQRMIQERKKRKEREMQKDWEKIAQRQERHIEKLRKDIEAYQKVEKDQEEKLIAEKVNVKKLQEKLSQERSWHDQEQKDIGKHAGQLKELKEDLKKAQESFAQEHAIHLRMERDFKEIQKEMEKIQEDKRHAEGEVMGLKAKADTLYQEVLQLRKENKELKKKSEDVTWIAKSEYVKLEQQLKEKEKELQRIYRELRER